MARLQLSSIEASMNTRFVGRAGGNELWTEIGSTNDRACELALAGAAEGVMVLARRQTGGRGRQGKSWISPLDAGIFVSFVLRPPLDPAVLPLVSFAAGVAAVEAIERLSGLAVGLKWVNDLVCDSRKLGGILVEFPGGQAGAAVVSSGEILPPAVICGLGINLNLSDSDLSADLAARVCSIDQLCGKPVDANLLVAELCSTLEDEYNHLRHGGHELVLSQWKKHSQTLGKRIKALCGQEELEGTAVDLSDAGALILRMDSGETRLLHAGEITIRLADGRYA
jgi:BirA family transcriptional regulator, biotin operon repressor / biotin---[acetyl-CoA-carboxylase] ligase